MKGFVTLILSSLLASGMSAPVADPQETNPFALLGNFIQRLQTSFNEGSESARQAQNNGLYPVTPESPRNTENYPSTTGTTPTTTPRTTTRPRTSSRPTNPFDSINAILDNISRGSNANGNAPSNNNNNNVFGNVPGRNLPDSSFTTPRPSFFPPPPPPTTKQPFSLDGINQGINAFFQAFLKTNIQNLFKQPDQRNQQISARSDNSPPPSLIDSVLSAFFNKKQN